MAANAVPAVAKTESPFTIKEEPMIRVKIWKESTMGLTGKDVQPIKVPGTEEEKEFIISRWEALTAKPINPQTRVEEKNYFEVHGLGFKVLFDPRINAE